MLQRAKTAEGNEHHNDRFQKTEYESLGCDGRV